MIYRVVLDGQTDILTSDNPLINPSVELEMNSAGSFNFTLPPTHPAWDMVKVLLTTVEVYEDNELIFTGRVANIDKNWNNERVVECEGALAYFNDSVYRPMKWETPIDIAIDPDQQTDPPTENFLQYVLDNHNAAVPENRRIYMGHIYIDPCKVTREVNYEVTLDILTRMCIDTNGGWFMIRKNPTDGKLYLDWLKDFTQESNQPAQFGLNLLNFDSGVHAEDVCTGVLAKGAEVNDQTLLLTDVELVDETTYPEMSVTHYTDHEQDILWHREGVEKFGKVVQVHDFSDAQTAWKDRQGVVVDNSLFEMARKWLEQKNTKIETIEVEVAELGWLGEGYPTFRLGQIVQLNDEPHMTGEPSSMKKLPMYKMSCDLNSGSKKVTLGTPPKKELTQISASNSDSNTLQTGGTSSGSGSSSGGGSSKNGIKDVKVNGESVVDDGVAEVQVPTDYVTQSTYNAGMAQKASVTSVENLADAVSGLSTVVQGKQNSIDFNTQEAATEVLTRLKADGVVYNLGGGTDVEANPLENPTDDLEKIKIGNTVYDIPGSGGSNYGQFVCETIFDTATRSNGWGDPVTICTKDVLDEYDAIYVTDGMTTNGAIRQETKFILIKDIESIGDTGYQYMFGTDPNGTSFFVFGLRVYNNNLIWYSDRDGGYLFKVYGLKFENQRIYLPALYSEEEREVGVWTDGKPLYQKTITINSPYYDNNWHDVAHNISNIDTIGSIEAILNDSNGAAYYALPAYRPQYTIGFIVGATPAEISYMNNWIEFPTEIKVTIQYTKTTDNPGSGTWTQEGQLAHHYSTSEKVVGTWIDGSTLYERTWDFSASPITLTYDTWVDTTIQSSDGVSNIISAECLTSDFLVIDGNEIRVGAGNYPVGISAIINHGRSLGYLTLRYTKSSS